MNKNKITFSNITKVHFIGVGGISMSGLAKICLSYNKIVSGSDCVNSETCKELKKMGAKIYIGHNVNNIDCCDCVVCSGAISSDNVEFVKAKNKGIPCFERGEFLNLIAKTHPIVIAVSGTHGKTTTTALISKILIASNVNPTVHLGGNVNFLPYKNVCVGQGIFVTEACEYKNNFLYTKNYIGAILNVEPEHLDFFATYENEIESFKQFARNSRFVVANYNLLPYFEKTNKKENIVSVSLTNEKANWFVKNIKRQKFGYTFEVYKNTKFYIKLRTSLIGEYNIYNIVMAVAVCDFFNIEKSIVKDNVFLFYGVERRMQKIGYINKVPCYIDYAHHPTEIYQCLTNFKQFVSGEILIVFQPHTYSRTKLLFANFVSTFKNEQNDILFLPTYKAREKSYQGYSSYKLYCEIVKYKSNVYYKNNLILNNDIKLKLKNKKAVIFIGAGNIDKLAYKLCKKIKSGNSF